jgi:hypothetical protein
MLTGSIVITLSWGRTLTWENRISLRHSATRPQLGFHLTADA